MVRAALRGAALLIALAIPAALHAQTEVVNSAAATYETIGGVDSVASNEAQTTFVFPEIFLEKVLVGPGAARVGDEIAYTLRYGNSSISVEARDVVLSDTLPEGLEYVTAQPAAQADDRTLTWMVGDLAPGDTTRIDLTVRVSDAVRDTMRVSNQAVLVALNASAEVATAAEVELVGLSSTQLTLEKTADVLEVGLGETAPYTLILENTGTVPLGDLRIHDRLPQGGRYSKGSAIGADSVRASGRDLTFFFAGPVDAGGTHTVRYSVAVVSAETDLLANTAFATAEADFVRSPESTAWVRVRKSWPMETRAAIGKVWVDLDGDGRQEAGEPGVEGVDIWSDDGEMVSTDTEGKLSFHNVRPGRHAFRLDPATVPARYRVAGAGAAGDLVVLDADGWTTPRINFRLLPRGARLTEVRLPVSWRFTAFPVCAGLQERFPSARDGRATLARFESNSAEPRELPMFAPQRVRALTSRPECRFEIAGHADPRPIRVAGFQDNTQLSLARARSVAEELGTVGLGTSNVTIRGYGATRLRAAGDDPYSLWLNRRVELRLSGPGDGDAAFDRPLVEYEVVIDNHYEVALSDLTLRFRPLADSARTVVGDSVLSFSGDVVPLPPIAPHSRLALRGWSRTELDSAAAVLEVGDRATSGLFAAIHNYLIPVSGVARAHAVADSLPRPIKLPEGSDLEIVLAPAAAGWPEVTYTLPSGWEPVPGSVRLGGHPADDPELRHDRDGDPVLYWRFQAREPRAVTLRLAPAGSIEPVEVVRVPPLRSDEERQAERERAFLAGPGVEIFTLSDGVVLRSDRTYVGVRGEPGAPVALFDGDSLLAEANLRIDGVHDFIGVGLARGPHRLRVRMRNSWNQERWDSLAVHVTGAPASLVPERDVVRLRADGHSTEAFRVRVLDRWGVPIVNAVHVTVEADGAEALGADTDASSVGLQLRSDPAGWLTVPLRPGREVGRGVLRLSAGSAEREIRLEVMAASRPLLLTGVGRIGLGASPDAFGAFTARGRLDDRTSVTVSYDSRRLDAGRDFFGRSYDPLEQAQYPIFGDASRRRTVSASEYALSARIERGFDWFALGDISTGEFTSGLNLSAYHRSLPGAAARVTTGPVVWKAFGSSTTQGLQQLQIRGAGTSGPYELAEDIRPGTDQVFIETRARENAQRVLTRQTLARFIDYQIDYARGTLLFKRPVPAADASQNPVFIVVSFEAESGGPRQETWGIRSTVDADRLIPTSGLDSLRVGATWIHDGQSGGDRELFGADVRLARFGGLGLAAEFSHAQSPDSSDFAVALDGSLRLFDGALDLAAGWMRIGDEFRNPSNAALRAGTEEIRVGAGLHVGASELRLEHERQTFDSEGVSRQRTRGGILQSLGSRFEFDAGLAADRFESGGSVDRSQAAELRLTWQPDSRTELWTEARRQLAHDGNVIRPDYVGGGGAITLARGVSVEAGHRLVFLPGDGADYSVTNLGLRTDLGLGTQAWGSYQIAGSADGAHNAAVIGLNNRLRLGDAWSVNTLFERRFGLERADVADPVRALPFLQAEEDYWSAALGVELLPSDAPYRASARGEYRDGDFQSSRLITLAGDISINRSLAVLSRNEFLETEQKLASGVTSSRRRSTLWGLAFRPIGSDALNILTKFEWLDENRPTGGGVFTGQGDEQRLIGAAEAIWAPLPWTEVGARYALRRTEADRLHEDGVAQALVSWADYAGGRLDLDLARWLSLRGEGRLLIERTSDTRRWDFAPSLVFIPINGFEAQFGYRFGDLRDPDFAVRGGHGLFVTFSARLTERVFPTAADFWRHRFGG